MFMATNLVLAIIRSASDCLSLENALHFTSKEQFDI